MTIEKILEAVRGWQSSEAHPVTTCGAQSRHRPLEPVVAGDSASTAITASAVSPMSLSKQAGAFRYPAIWHCSQRVNASVSPGPDCAIHRGGTGVPALGTVTTIQTLLTKDKHEIAEDRLANG